jgi:hypothetical protein
MRIIEVYLICFSGALKKAPRDQRFKSDRDMKVPMEAKGFVCGCHLSAGASVERLPRCPWGLFLIAHSLSPRIILEQVVFNEVS